MHQTPTDHTTTSEHEGTSSKQDPPRTPGLLSQSDPEPERSTSRAPIWLIILIVLLVTGFVILHLTGAVGPAMH